MTTDATTPASTALTAAAIPGAPCRSCRLGRAATRAVAFTAGGIAVALIVSWAVSVAPWLGVLLGLVSTVLFARALLMVFFRPSPIVALTHMGASIALGIVVAGLVGMLLA